MADLTEVDFWNRAWSGDIRLRLPSPWIVSTRDLQRLIARYVQAGQDVLEIGCAPGKILAWVAANFHAQVSGLDYSPRGFDQARRLFAALRIPADLRCEDLRQTTFPRERFDLVYSIGVIEHFDDPREVVRNHLSLVRPGGTALMTVPNYRGIYGTCQQYFDRELLLRHNLDIMTCEELARLAPEGEQLRVRTYRAGRITPWMLTPLKRWPAPIALGLSSVVNAIGLLQPIEIASLAPLLALEITRPPAPGR